MTREDYARDYATGFDRRGPLTSVPEDVERVAVHEPCFRCGVSRALCKHRRLAA